VFRVSAAYVALGWVVTQVTSAVVPALNLPAAVPSIVVWLGIIGFPFVVVFSWVYELTPEGLKRESEVDRAASIAQVTGRRLDYIVIAMLAVAILLFAFSYFRPSSGQNAAPAVVSESETAAPAQEIASAPEVASMLKVDDKSIAVLPFVNMSSDPEQEYFSDGMSEELLNLLAQAHDLRVIARTSSFAFKGKDVPIAEIARQLNVAHVLEGSVRKSGNKVRITAQLIRTADSTHLWSESYDRSLDDIFAVQDEIANAIVQALQIRIAGGELNRRKGGTQNLEAYQLYLRGIRAVFQNTRASLESATGYLKQAVTLDPNYGRAWMQLGHAAVAEADNGFADPIEGYGRARELAQKALQLSPDIADAHAMLQYIHQTLDWDWAAAEAEGRRALAIDPSNPLALNVAGKLASTLGRWDEAEQQLRSALIRDPLYTYALFNLGMAYYLSGRFDQAEHEFSRLLELEPDFLWTRAALGKALLAQGKKAAALEIVQGNADRGERLWALPIVLQAAGQQREADQALKEPIAYWDETGAYAVALSYSYRGDRELAFEWLERAYRQKDPALIEIVGEPLLNNIADDPRYTAFLLKMNLPLIRPVAKAGS
jgi:TolB-like protein/Flp pilus assembly protein TadD